MTRGESPPPGVARLIRARAWPLVVWTAMLCWSIALFGIVRSDYGNFSLARFDLGNMVQAVWSTAHGRPLEMTDATGEQIVRFASHVDPVLVLLAPLWIVAPTPLTLAAVQIAACALGALPVFWLARRHLSSEKAAALLALAYLAYPWLAWTALDAFHPVTLAIPVFLYAIWSLDTGRLWAFAVCAVVALATGELMGLPLAALGVWYWLSRGHRRVGLMTAVAGLGWTVICLTLIAPAFRDGQSPFFGRYESVGGSPQGVAKTVVADPMSIASALGSGDDLVYLLWLGAPLLGMFLLSPALVAVAGPQILVNGLSDWQTTTDPRHHYIAGAVPFLLAAAVLGLGRLPRARRVPWAAAVLAASGALALMLGPWPGAPGARPIALHTEFPETHVDALAAAVALVPANEAVSATNAVGSQLSERRYLYSVPVTGRARWIVLDTWNTWMPGTASREEGLQPELMRAFLDRVRTSAEWRLVFERDRIFVFQRKSEQ